MVFCFKQKTAYELRISDWSSDVCSSDLFLNNGGTRQGPGTDDARSDAGAAARFDPARRLHRDDEGAARQIGRHDLRRSALQSPARRRSPRSEEHTSELQSLMRISYAVFCLKKKTNKQHNRPSMSTIPSNINHRTENKST